MSIFLIDAAMLLAVIYMLSGIAANLWSIFKKK